MPKELLVEAGKKGGNVHKHKWTEAERDIVRRDYDGTNNISTRIASKLTYMTGDKITFVAVKGQAAKMGIMQNKSPDWTDKEIEILTKMISQYAPITIAKRLHRSLNAVVVKSKRLGLSRRIRDGWFTKKEVCEILGVDHKKVQKWIDNGELKAQWHTEIKPVQSGAACWHIMQGSFVTFIRSHAGELVGRNVDLFMIVELLAGVISVNSDD